MSEAVSISGQCLCGAVSVELHSPKDSIEICHCDMCRRFTGSYYAAMEGENFTLTGEDAIRTYQSSDWAERAFCGTCGSSLWYKFTPTGHRSFLAGLFSEADTLPVGKEIFVDEQARWSDLGGDHKRQTGPEVIAEAKAAGFSFD